MGSGVSRFHGRRALGQDAAGDADSVGMDSLGAASLGAASLGAATLGAVEAPELEPGAGVQAMSAAPRATANKRRLNMRRPPG